MIWEAQNLVVNDIRLANWKLHLKVHVDQQATSIPW